MQERTTKTYRNKSKNHADTKGGARVIVFALGILLIIALSNCQPDEPEPTPTPTRTPILPTSTPTPTLTPTPTPTPTPTLPPDLILRPPALKPETWPKLPQDIYFRREGRLWHWLAEGNILERIPMVEETAQDQVLSYQLAAAGQFIAYVTTSEKLYVLDRALWEHLYIPTTGQILTDDTVAFDMTPDGHYLVYIAWGVYPNTEAEATPPPSDAPFGTLLAIDVENLRNPQIILGLCESDPSPTSERHCQDLMLSPDGTRLVFTDKHGLWMSQLPDGNPQLVAAYPSEDRTVWQPLAWSPEGERLLLRVQRGREQELTLLQFEEVKEQDNPEPRTIAQFQVLPETQCGKDCELEFAWGPAGNWGPDGLWKPAGVWINKIDLTDSKGELYLIETSSEGEPQITRRKSIAHYGALRPTEMHPLADGRVAFIHQGCQDCAGLQTGIYYLELDDSVRPVALLSQPGGSLLWSYNGNAFLYFDPTSNPTWLGLLSNSVLWDVVSLLDRAGDFQWVVPYPPTPPPE